MLLLDLIASVSHSVEHCQYSVTCNLEVVKCFVLFLVLFQTLIMMVVLLQFANVSAHSVYGIIDPDV